MKRRDILKTLGTLGVGSTLPVSGLLARDRQTLDVSKLPSDIQAPNCVLIPSETRGPYPLDLSADSNYFRQDITEGKAGIPFTLVLNIVNINNACSPVESARVDIWHCDADGVYSGYQQPGANTVGQTFCRGIQLTDSNGQVTFTTIYPGWYAGRITHIHFEVFLNSVLSVTSQVAFPEATTAAVYNTYAKGQNTSVASFAQDNVFGDGTTNQMLEVTGNTTDGFVGTLTVGIDGATTTGLQRLEPDTGGQFSMQQNFPNPFSDETEIGLELHNAAQVVVTVFDLQGRRRYEALNAYYPSGHHVIALRQSEMGLSAGSYVYEVRTINEQGTFFQAKLMTVR